MLSHDNGNTITNPYNIANTYFASIADTTKNNIKYLKEECDCTIFLKPTSKEEIGNTISSLNSNNAFYPNNIPYKILFLLKNEISMQLADLFNPSFVTGVFFHQYSKLQR